MNFQCNHYELGIKIELYISNKDYIKFFSIEMSIENFILILAQP